MYLNRFHKVKKVINRLYDIRLSICMKKDSTAKTIEFLHAYGKCENDTMENAKPSPVEKGGPRSGG